MVTAAHSWWHTQIHKIVNQLKRYKSQQHQQIGRQNKKIQNTKKE
jgi:hypothetical protein